MFIINTFSTCFGHHYAIFRRTRRILLHVVCCAVTSGEMLDISFNVFFVWYCVVNLGGTSCVYENVVCKLVCRGVGLVYVSCVHQTWKTQDTYTSPTPRTTNLHTTFSYTHEIPSRFTTQYHTKKTLRLISNFPRLLQRSTPHAVT